MRILIPVDGSACSRNAIRFIAERAEFMGEKPAITLMNAQHAIPELVFQRFGLEAARLVYEEEGRSIIARCAEELAPFGLEAESTVCLDECGPAAASKAAEIGADLIAMGSRGLSAAKSFFLGSASRSVLEHTSLPVLLVREKPLPKKENLRILLAVDGSDYGDRAAAFIADNPGLFGPKPAIDVLYAMPDYTATALQQIDGLTPAKSLATFLEEAEHAWEKAVGPVIDTLQDAGFEARPVKIAGNPAKVIADYAAENSDLIVMGSHGWGTVKSAVLGSTAAKVGAATTLPVLIIRSESDEPLV